MSGASGARPPTIPVRLADRLLIEIGGWLDDPDPPTIAGTTSAWGDASIVAASRLIEAHGLAARLASGPAGDAVTAALPAAVALRVRASAAANRGRIARLHDELAAALRALAGAGIETMPLKGSVLTTRPGTDPARRPMADLDLLVHIADRDGARAVLSGLGYVRRDDRSRRPTHDTFERPGNDRIVALDLEHPDNPRRIELHTEVKRHLWGWVDDDDLTDLLWTDARRGSVLGEPATLPTQLALLAHLAIHATSDLLMSRGRLIQWLDLAEVAPSVAAAAGEGSVATSALESLPHPRLAYPALRLAQRRLPRRLGGLALEGLAAAAGRRVAAWTDRVALDHRAGLTTGRVLPGDASSWAARWTRWAPAPWRLAVADGDRPLPAALARHLGRVASLAVTPRRPAG